MTHLLLQADARRIPLADGSVHCVVTSPPYWGLRDYGVEGQIGLEESPDAFIESMVMVFREVYRVLRDDGTLWLNLGDTYNNSDKWGGGGANTGKHTREPDGTPASWKAVRRRWSEVPGLKPKDLVGIPWRVALALQADGWYLRSAAPWVKRGAMPESVSDRPSSALEYVFLFAKSERYFFDMEPVRLRMAEGSEGRYAYSFGGNKSEAFAEADKHGMGGRTRPIGNGEPTAGRSLRNSDFWFQSVDGPLGMVGVDDEIVGFDVVRSGFRGAHFATFPPKLVEPCIKAGTSEKGCCPDCGAPWERVTETSHVRHPNTPGKGGRQAVPGSEPSASSCFRTGLVPIVRTLGWQPSCSCPPREPVPCVVLDPFSGSGTTVSVATGLGRRGIGLDLNREYIAMARRRVERPHAPACGADRDEVLPLFAAL